MKQLLIVNSAKALNAGITSTADLSGLEEGAITFINPKSTTPISAKPTENFAIALGRANGQLPFMISEVDVKSLTVNKATPVTGVAMKRTFTVPTITAGKEMGVMLIKKGTVPHERNTWTAVVTATGTPATDAAAIKTAIDSKTLPFTVTVASAKVTITATSTKELWEVKLTDALSGVAFSTTSGETADPVIPTGDKAYIEKLASMGHSSPFCQVSYTFGIENVSRAFTHQFARHHVGVSFDQRSQRYVNEGKFNYITPPAIEANDEIHEKFQAFMEYTSRFYNEMVSAGIKKEDARSILPNACETKLIATINAQELFHIFGLRCCNRTQFEFRQVANEMLCLVKEVSPKIFKNAGAHCDMYGYCPEGDMCCGKAPTLQEVLKGYKERISE